MGLRRRRIPHDRRTTVLIVGEGQETEPIYFSNFKGEAAVRRHYRVSVVAGPGRTPEAVVRKAIDSRKTASQRHERFDEVWCVLDVEGPENRRLLNEAVKLATENGIRVCLSNPAFEVWFLAHFKRTKKSFLNCDAVIRDLHPLWQSEFGKGYSKSDRDLYLLLSTRHDAAIRNARDVREKDHEGAPNTADANSSTDVYRLVEHLLGR